MKEWLKDDRRGSFAIKIEFAFLLACWMIFAATLVRGLVGG